MMFPIPTDYSDSFSLFVCFFLSLERLYKNITVKLHSQIHAFLYLFWFFLLSCQYDSNFETAYFFQFKLSEELSNLYKITDPTSAVKHRSTWGSFILAYIKMKTRLAHICWPYINICAFIILFIHTASVYMEGSMVFFCIFLCTESLGVRALLLLSWLFDFAATQKWIPSLCERFDNLQERFCLCHRQVLNVCLRLPGTNGQEWLLILYCWIFNHPINLSCDKASLATLGKNISACNLHHISLVNGSGE